MTDTTSKPVQNRSPKITNPQIPIKPQASRIKGIQDIPKGIISRASFPDLTGLYESVPNKVGTHSAVMLQLNQAGKVIVGWFVPPPAWMPNRSDTKSRSPEENQYMMPAGVLFGEITKPLIQGLDFFWTPANIQIKTPEDLLENFTHDPSDIIVDRNKKKIEGKLKPLVIEGELDSIYLSFNADRLNNADVMTSPFVERFIRIKAIPRVSNYIRSFLPKKMQEALLAEQICPLPTSFVDAARGTLAPFDTPASIPPVAQLLKQWRHANNSTEKEIKRTQITNIIYSVLLDNRSSRTYLIDYQRKLRAHMSSHTLVIDAEKKTYWEWYQAVLGEEIDRLEEFGKKLDKNNSPLFDIFSRAGIETSGKFVYTLTFESVSLNPLHKYAKLGFSLNFIPFLVKIKKELIVYESEVDGKIKLVDGVPVEKQRISLPWDQKNSIMGFYFEAGISLSLNQQNKVGEKLRGEFKTTHKGSLGPFEFKSNISINSSKEFEKAYFFMGMVGTPSASLGNYISFDSLKSTYVEIHLDNNIVLTNVNEESLKFTPPKMPGMGKVLKPKEYVEGWTQPKLGARLFDFSGGWGLMLELPGKVSLSDHHQLHEPREDILKDKVTAPLQNFFEVDSADIDQIDNQLYFTSRTVLELFLAQERAALSNEDTPIIIKGYSSPEHDSDHNQKLSQRRADTVKQGIIDAFFPTLRFNNIEAIGLGEEFFLKYDLTLKNPPEPHFEWAKAHPEQVSKWPELRRVDVEINGTFIAGFHN